MNKTIFITGTSTGFGKLTAITLAKAGYTVIAGMRGTTGKNAAVANELSALPNLEVVEIDVTDDEFTPALTPVFISVTEQFNAIGAGLFGKMAEFNMDPQTIADGILKLIGMEDGTRPLRLPLDAIAEGTDIEFINARAEIKAKWLAKYSA